MKLPSGKFRVQFRVGEKRCSVTASTKTEALRLAYLKQSVNESETDITVRLACENYITSRASILSPNTKKEYVGYLTRNIDLIANKKLSTLSSVNLQSWVNNLSENLSPKTVKNIYGFVMASINSQMPSKRFRITLPRRVKVDRKMPSEAEIKAITNEVRGSDMEVPFLMALYCCLRRGEISGLLNHKECVGKDYVTVRYNVVKTEKGWVEKAPKTYTSYRTIPCPMELTSKIKEARAMTPASISCMWSKLMKRMGLNYSFHTIRHLSASLMLSTGKIPLVDVEKFGGWAHGSSVLLNTYTHNIDESLLKSAETWRGKLREIS